MIIRQTEVESVLVIEPELLEDDRGFFARIFCTEELAAHGIQFQIAQINASYNRQERTIRGLHYQTGVHAEAKLIRCTAGAVFDVVVDMRPESPTYLRHFGVVLSAENRLSVYVPRLCAHGYLALSDGAEILYPVDVPYVASAERGVRYDDPVVDIEWPIDVRVVSEKDRSWPTIERDRARGA